MRRRVAARADESRDCARRFNTLYVEMPLFVVDVKEARVDGEHGAMLLARCS